jgi:molecular chaperone GrpE
MRSGEDESQGPVIRDRRRIDPVTGQVRDTGSQGSQNLGNEAQPGSAQHGPARPRPGKHAVSQPGGSSASAAGNGGGDAPGSGGGGSPEHEFAANETGAGNGLKAETERLAAAVAERTADLQRLQAEYANYRKRVERDRLAVREQALANVLTELLPVLDDIGRAREHGELTGGFKSVAESLESVAVKLGLGTYGEDGDPFDPRLHEALMHSYSPDVTEATCVRILQPGYKVGDRILRPARVAVAEPESPRGPGDEHHEPDEDAGEDHARSSGHSGGEPPAGGSDGTD